MTTSPHQVLVIAGPTASGKSALAQQMALERGGEILNFDSQQFYQGLEIGTGKVPKKTQKVRHWFLEILNPGDPMSAMKFVHLAEPVIQSLQEKGKLPILVGGTGLYLRALLEGLDPLPGRHPPLRAQLEEELKQMGSESLHQRLQKVDPGRAAQIKPQDSARIIRALEIYQLTGKPPSELLKRGRPHHLKYRSETYWLSPPREALHQRIATRVGQMFAQGWVFEVQGLMKQGHDPRAWSQRPLGYAEIAEALEQGQEERPGLQEKIILKTRQYAKRQETFFRGLFDSEAYQKNGSSLTLQKELISVVYSR